MIDWPKVVRDLEAENAELKHDIDVLLELAKDIGHLQLSNKRLQRELEQTKIALAEQKEMNIK